MNPRIAAFALLSSVACQRATNSPPPPPPPPVDRPSEAPPVVAQPPSADGLVLTPGEGLGPYSLGMSREAVRALAGEAPAAGDTVEIDGVTLLFAPDGTVVSVTARLGRTAGGVRVGASALANNASYADVIAAVGPCDAPQANRGATVTRCQSGGITVLRAGPTQELSIGVMRGP